MGFPVILRDYQQSIYDQVVNSTTHDVVQLDTGGGKTPIIAHVAKHQPTICVAHRNMLVEQISDTLTKLKIDHSVIATPKIQKRCQLVQRRAGVEFGGQVHVASIQSLISWHKRGRLPVDTNQPFKIIIDEAHHTAKDNMWASLADIFPNAQFLGVTATPCRLDGQGLHVDCGGLFDRLVQADQLRDNSAATLIARGHLSEYEMYCPPASVDWKALKIGSTGDYTESSLSDAIDKTVICGEIVEHYKRLARNKRGLVFAVSIANAEAISDAYKAAGISSTYIASKLSIADNMRRIDAFRAGDVQVLINVEMATEGFDLPEIEVVQVLRPTASFVLWRQMIGRVLRPKPNGQHAIILDHVANTLRHGLPDDQIVWSLYGLPENKSEPVTDCRTCHKTYNVYLSTCPHCGAENWIHSTVAMNDALVQANIIPVELVRKWRDEAKQREINAVKAKAIAEHQIALQTVPMPPRWIFAGLQGAYKDLCTKLSSWMFDNLKDVVPPSDLNRWTQGKEPALDFFMDHFTAKDLSATNPTKCKKVLKHALKSY